jgi:drug/metabolite transporter (DMT)-like permease
MQSRYTTIQGILFMLLNTIALAILDISAKTLRETMGSAHIVFIYKGILLLAILPWVFNKGFVDGLRTEKIYVHLVRSFFSVLGSIFFVHGLHYVNMADAAALENIQYVFLALIGVVFFKEEPTIIKILALILGFCGAVIVVKPSVLQFITGQDVISSGDVAYGYTLMAIGFWTMNSVLVKILGRTEKSKIQLFYLMFFTCLWTTPFIFIEWHEVSIFGFEVQLIPVKYIGFSAFNVAPENFKYLILMAACFFIHAVAYFKALKREMSIVITFRYTKLLFSGILGYMFFMEIPNKVSLIGYTLIIISGLILLLAEYMKARNKKIIAANLHTA